MIVQLPFPNKALWPNGDKPHWRTVSDQKKKHKAWAYAATLAALGGHKFEPTGDKIPVRLTVSSKPKGPPADKDNCVAAAKIYIDGIAMALGVNDRLFDAPIVHFSGRNSSFTIEVGQ